jgi:nucleoid-associated protein EbfC
MKLPENLDFGKIMQQAQQMQQELQQSLKEARVEASSGGGIVKVVMSGDKQIVTLAIDPQAAQDDVEMLQDLIIAAVNECSRKVDEVVQQQALKNLNIPGLGGLL